MKRVAVCVGASSYRLHEALRNNDGSNFAGDDCEFFAVLSKLHRYRSVMKSDDEQSG